MQRLLDSKKFDTSAAFFVAPALSLKNTFFNDFLVCTNNIINNEIMYRTLSMIIKGNKFWTKSGQVFISQCIL